MTTYTIDSTFITAQPVEGDESNPLLEFFQTEMRVTVEDHVDRFAYAAEVDSGGIRIDWTNAKKIIFALPNGQKVKLDNAIESNLVTVNRSEGSTTMLSITFPTGQSGTEKLLWLHLGGDPFPQLSSIEELRDFALSIDSTTSNLLVDPGPEDSVLLSALGATVETEDDVFSFNRFDQWHDVGLGNDRIDARDGIDMISFVNMTSGMAIDMTQGTAMGGQVQHSFENFESVTGSIFGDYIVGDEGNNRLRGLGDYDWFIGSDGSDRYEGGTGRDMVSYIMATAGVTVDLSNATANSGLAAGDTFDSVERITGSSFADVFYGTDGADDFRGLGGYDTFHWSEGRDRYYGGNGLDTVSYEGATQGVNASLLLGRGSVIGSAQNLYQDIENLTGGQLHDVLTGDSGRNILIGHDGDDQLFGNGGVDRLHAGNGNDYLDGGAGWDYAIFEKAQSEYTINTDDETGQTWVVDLADFPEGVDLLTNIEVLSFADGDVIL